jgi:membrane protease YdiL (CAAX protease family)
MYPDDNNQEDSLEELKTPSSNPYAQYAGTQPQAAGVPSEPQTYFSPGSPGEEPIGSPPVSLADTADLPPPAMTATGILVNSICFIMVFGLVSLILYWQNFQQDAQATPSPQGELVQLIVQGKVSLGLKVLLEKNPELENPPDEEMFPFGNFGSVRIRQAGSVMVAELVSADEALARLEKLEDQAISTGYQFNESQKQITRLLRQVFHGESTDLTESERELLSRELLWFGQLALNPETQEEGDPKEDRSQILSDAESVFFCVIGTGLGAFAGLVVGFFGLIILWIMYCKKTLKVKTSAVSQEPTIYLESFTVWIFSFMFFSLLLGLVAPELNPLIRNLLVFLISFCGGMCWPIFRGKSGKTLFKDIGFCGHPLVEILMALWCYVCSLPLMLVGFFVTFILILDAAPSPQNDLVATGAHHPLMEWIMNGDLGTIILVYFAACIAAPIVEETFFRGFFYRALKDSSHRLGSFLSMLFAALINGLVFAAIHPQGIFFIPVLCSLGMAFSFVREWRGSVWTPMAMHAIHNGLLTTVLVFAITP